MSADDTEKGKLASAIKRLLENSTVHGLPKIVSSSRIAVKILWCFLFMAAFVLFAIQLNGLIEQFNSNPRQTTIALASGKVKFPAITFCNMNVVKLSKVPLHSQLNELVTPRRTGIGGAGILNFVSPIETDIFDVLLDGYMISEDFISEYFPTLSYWEVITRLRNIYFEHNQIPGDPNIEATLMSENELLVLLGEEILTTTRPLPPTTTNSKMNTKKTPGSDYTGVPEPYISESSSLEPTETHETPTSGTTESNANETFSTIATSTGPFTKKIFDPADPPYHIVVALTKSNGYTLHHFGPYFGEILGKRKYNYHPFRLWKAISTLFKAITRGQSRDFRNVLGHQFEDLMISSYFAGQEENVTYKGYWTQEYGNCYTIDSPKYETRHSGLAHGFELVFDLEMDEYVTSVQESQGMRIVLHEPGTIPFPNEGGITLAPGYDHQIGLKIIETSRLGKPYGDCTDGEEFRRNYKTNYTRTTCISICKAEIYVKECGCMPEDPPEILDEHFDLQVCEYSTSPSVKACVERVEEKLIDIDQACNCVEPCSTTAYVKTISGKPWPTDEYMSKVIVDNMCDYNDKLKPSIMKLCHDHWGFKLDKKKYRNNFMKVQIYFEDMQYQIVKEEPTYGVVRFLSDIGGTAGLFIGASVLSIFEIFQVILEIILYCQHKGKPQVDRKTQEERNNRNQNVA